MDKMQLQVRDKLKKRMLRHISFIDTYIYVGIGHFPDQIEKQEKATVVGQKRCKIF
jgi:hypothetical protein